jgi:hypothetical protein
MGKRLGRPPLPAVERKSAHLNFVTTEKIERAIEFQARIKRVRTSDIIRAALVEYLEDQSE